MKQLNTLPIEDFLDKARIARKSNQRSLILTSKEFTDLADSISLVMTRLSGNLDQTLSENQLPDTIEIRIDGGKF
jgi:hypothetical protein